MGIKINYIPIQCYFIALLLEDIEEQLKLTAAPIARFKMDIRDTKTPPTIAHAPPHNCATSFISPIVIAFNCQVL